MKEKEKPYSILDFSFIPNYDGAINYLATQLADEEEWDFADIKESDRTRMSLSIFLRSYFAALRDQ